MAAGAAKVCVFGRGIGTYRQLPGIGVFAAPAAYKATQSRLELPPLTATVNGSPGCREVGHVSAGGAPSSFVIVAWPWGSAIDAPEGELRFTKKVSLGSGTVSPWIATAIGFVVSPGAK